MKNAKLEIVIRRFTSADGSTVAEIWASGLNQTVLASSWVLRPLMKWSMDYLRTSSLALEGDVGPGGINLARYWTGKDRCFFVAERDGAVVGCCGVKLGTSDGGKNDGVIVEHVVCSVWRLSVADEARLGGVGKKLMAAAEAWGQRMGCRTITATTGNPLAKQFYQRLGFQSMGWRAPFGYEKSL